MVNSKSNPTPLLYVGLHPQTMIWINQPPFSVKGVARLDFLLRWSFNPANILFGLFYRLHLNNIYIPRLSARCLELFFLTCCSGVYRRYARYFSEILIHKISIVDVADIDSSVVFIKNNNIEAIIVNSWSLLPKELVSAPLRGAINIHPSRLPAYRGALPTLWSLKNGDKETAVSFLAIDESVDGGNIISQYSIEIGENDSSLDLERRIDIVIKKHFHKDVSRYLSGVLHPFAQSGTPSDTARYAQYALIDWRTENARDIYNKILLYPYLEPFFYCYSNTKNKAIFFKGVRSWNTKKDLTPGFFLRKGITLSIGTVNGTVVVKIFKDISFMSSLYFLLKQQGNF